MFPWLHAIEQPSYLSTLIQQQNILYKIFFKQTNNSTRNRQAIDET